MAPLALAAGGWGQVENGWATPEDPEFKRFRALVVACIEPLPPDVNGTCGRDGACACGDCWVRLNRLNRGPLKATGIR